MSNLSKINNQELLNFIRGDEYQGPISFAAQDLGVSEALIDFIRDEHIKVEGSFSANNQLYVIYSKIVTPSEYVDNFDYNEYNARHVYDESRRTENEDDLDAFEGDASNRWNID